MQSLSVSTSVSDSSKTSRRKVGLTSDGVLSLSVRSLDLAIELSGLPDDGAALYDRLVSERSRAIEAQYRSLCVIAKLREIDWRLEGYKTLDELLAELGLPSGRMLGRLNLVVEYFSRETILLVGFEPLGFLLMSAASRQKNAEKRREEIALLLAEYCSVHSDFNRATFFRFISVKFPPIKKRRAKKPVKCDQCRNRPTLLTASMSHIEHLERFIAENLGKKFVPARPSVLR